MLELGEPYQGKGEQIEIAEFEKKIVQSFNRSWNAWNWILLLFSLFK